MTETSSQRDIAALAAATAYNIAAAEKRPWPYAHLMPERILPPELFAEARQLQSLSGALDSAAATRSDNTFQGETEAERHRFMLVIDSHSAARGKEVSPILAKLFAVLTHPLVATRLIARFREELHAEFRTDALPLTASLSYFENDPGYELLPHTDVATKVITLLIYLAEDDSHPELGTELFMLRPGIQYQGGNVMHQRFRRGSFHHVATAPYRPNHGLVFAPAGNTFHGVGKVEGVSGRFRRALQFQLLHADRNVQRGAARA